MAELVERLQKSIGDTYRLERELGGGGMSRVFLAEEVELARRVVIKVLPPEMAAGVNQDRFRREIQLAAKLQHPHIVPLLTAGSADDLLYYIMPYIEGEPLRAKLAREGELPIGEVARILRDVADALAYAHRHNVVHRDIKPDNVLLSDNHALVADFGVAKAVSESTGGASSLTSLGVALGTPAYMSPEQAAANPNVDHRADIYALGALAYEMLCGRPPFDGANAQAVLAAHVSRAPDPCTTHRASVPPALNEIVMRCLEKLPADRWQRADDLKVQFESMSTPSGGVTPTGTQPVAAVSAEPAMRQTHPVRVAGLFGLASIGVLIVVYALVQAIGLPYWVLVGAIGLLAVGLPIMMLTGHHERVRAIAQTTGVAVARPPGMKRHFTWQKSLMGGGLAFTGLAVIAASYMAMRTLGIGPAATLMATGALQEQDRLILADFENRTGDSTLGPSVTEAFRIDLAQSPVIQLMDVSEIAPVLQRMDRDPELPLDRMATLEIAEREGVKAVVLGEIGPVGSGFVLSARVITAADGLELLGLRENATNEEELLPSIDRLSGRLRERIGESLRTIRANEPLERVTTASPDALRKYSQGVRAFDRGEYGRARTLFEEAIDADTTFAMAYRKLAALLNNVGAPASLREEATRKAFTYRDRLPDIERYLATAYYYSRFAYDPERVRTAYLNLLELDPDNRTALNNLAVQLNFLEDPENAERYALQATERYAMGPAYTNAIVAQMQQGAFDRADSVLRRMEVELPDHPTTHLLRGQLIAGQRQFPDAEAHFDVLGERFATSRGWTAATLNHLAAVQQVQGKLAAAERHMRERLTIEAERDRPDNYLATTVGLAELHILFRGQEERAVTTVEQALERHPLSSMEWLDRPYFRLADFFAGAGRPDRAREFIDEYERVNDGVPRRPAGPPRSLSFSKGAVALAEGRYEDAAVLLRQAREQHWCKNCPHARLAVAYDRAGQVDSALAEYERLVSQTSYNRHFRDSGVLASSYKRLGELYEERGEREKAIEYYNSFVKLWSDADEELQEQVSEIRNRIARLVGER